MITIDDLIQKIKFYSPGADTDLIRLAYDYAKKAHEGQKRLNGEPYINHCLATAMNLAEMKLNQNIIIAELALLNINNHFLIVASILLVLPHRLSLKQLFFQAYFVNHRANIYN